MIVHIGNKKLYIINYQINAALNMPANLENTAVATGLEKFNFHSSPKEGQCQRMFKLLHNCTHFTCQQGNTQNPSSQASILCELRIYTCTSWIQENRGTRDQIANIHWSIEKTREFQKNIYFCFIDYTKAFDCVDHNKLWKILKRDGNTRPPDLSTEKSVCRSRSNCQNWTGNNKLVPNWERRRSRLLTKCHLAYSTYMQSTSCEMPGWMKPKLESRLLREISITSDMQMTPALWQKVKRT